jgi:hypothetical protein
METLGKTIGQEMRQERFNKYMNTFAAVALVIAVAATFTGIAHDLGTFLTANY